MKKYKKHLQIILIMLVVSSGSAFAEMATSTTQNPVATSASGVKPKRPKQQTTRKAVTSSTVG